MTTNIKTIGFMLLMMFTVLHFTSYVLGNTFNSDIPIDTVVHHHENENNEEVEENIEEQLLYLYPDFFMQYQSVSNYLLKSTPHIAYFTLIDTPPPEA